MLVPNFKVTELRRTFWLEDGLVLLSVTHSKGITGWGGSHQKVMVHDHIWSVNGRKGWVFYWVVIDFLLDHVTWLMPGVSIQLRMVHQGVLRFLLGNFFLRSLLPSFLLVYSPLWRWMWWFQFDGIINKSISLWQCSVVGQFIDGWWVIFGKEMRWRLLLYWTMVRSPFRFVVLNLLIGG